MSKAMEQAGRRRPPGGGYARGDEKRQRIIEAALQRFGAEGYERASTRQIARDAGVNPPALQYYFDSKEGLLVACAEFLAERLREVMRPAYARAEAVSPGDNAAAIEAVCGIVEVLTDHLLNTVGAVKQSLAESWSRFIARGQGEEGNIAAHHRLREEIFQELHMQCARLVGMVIDEPPDAIRTRLHSIAILGQLAGFHLGRDKALGLLGWDDFKEERLAMVKSVLMQQTRAILAAAGSERP